MTEINTATDVPYFSSDQRNRRNSKKTQIL